MFDTVANKYYIADPFSMSGAYVLYNNSYDTGTYTDAGDIANRSTRNWGTSDPMEVSAAYNISKTLEYYNALGFGVNNIAFAST